MKLQHLTIIFIIIIFPIALVVGEYIQAQIDTITLQSHYNKILQDATYDSIRAFQINTINNKYSSVSDSKIRDLEASVNTFYNSLGTSLGSSGYTAEVLKEYVPALLFTMYDGYYIYGKYGKYNNQTGEVNHEYGLKPYIFYACRYKYSDKDFVINYTLDNCITVYGNIGNNTYVTKSGYLVIPSKVSAPTNYRTDKYGNKYYISIKYGDVNINAEILKEYLTIADEAGNVEEPQKQYEYTIYNNQKIYKTIGKNEYFTYNKNQKHVLYDDTKGINLDAGKVLEVGEVTPLMYAKDVMTWGGSLHSNSGVEYYLKAKEFSTWVMNNSNIGGTKQSYAVDQNGNSITNFATNVGNESIFNFNETTNDPLMEGSTFDEHRMSVIRHSIETNLQSAIANFGSAFTDTYDFELPNLTEEDWHKILNNISLTAFLQGIPIKQKIYNSYSVVSNTKNEEVVTKDSIYVMTKKGNVTEVHLPGCSDLIAGNYDGNPLGAYNAIDFERQTITISDQNDRYNYPQQAQRCYHCISGSSRMYDITQLMKGKLYTFDTNANMEIYKGNLNAKQKTLRDIYMTGLARARWDLYRNNSYVNDSI